MILCVNPNAAIDKTVVVSPFCLNEIHRPQKVMAFPGGKGCNVARALKTLGDNPVVTGWVGGFAGQFIEAELHREAIQTDFVHLDFESRTCLSILDPENNTLTEIYEKGEPVPAEKVEAFKTYFQSIVRNYEAVTLSGSLPPGVPADFYAQLIDIAHAAHISVFLDSSGEALKQGLVQKPRLIKPNKKEVCDLVGKELQTLDDFVETACWLSTSYQTAVVLSLGAEGAIAVVDNKVLHVRPPQLTIQSAVGSGDSLLAGIVYGLTHSFSFKDAVKYGIAAGTANALQLGAGVFTQGDFEYVLANITLESY
jgi:tagatose 6-phosphate kinase